MAKTAKKKSSSTAKKSRPAKANARSKKSVMASRKAGTSKTQRAARSAKPAKRAAKSARPAAARRRAPARIDPLNRKNYTALTVMLSVQDVQRAADFYVRGLGFTLRGSMDGPDGRPVHAELRKRDTTLMLSPENAQMQSYSARTIGDTPATLYLLVEDVDDVFSSAVAAGARVRMPVQDMFWGDRCGEIADLDGNKWLIATHKSEPTPAQMQDAMRQMMMQASSAGFEQESASAASAGGGNYGSEY